MGLRSWSQARSRAREEILVASVAAATSLVGGQLRSYGFKIFRLCVLHICVFS